MAVCPSGPTYDTVATAGLYAQIGGVFAGFAFTALIIILRPREGEHRVEGLPLTLLAAFFSLVVSAITYAVLAGERMAPGRARVEQLIASLPFAMSIIMLLYGVSLLMAASSVVQRSSVRASQVLAAVAAPTLSMFFLTLAALDVETMRIVSHRAVDPTYCGSLEPIRTIGRVLIALLLILLIFAATWRPGGRLRRTARDLRSAAPLLALAMTMLAAVGVGLVSTQKPQFVLPTFAVIVLLCITALSFAAVGFLIMWGQPRLHVTRSDEA